MEIIPITPKNIYLLKDLINNLGNASKSFRYFNTRSTDVINNHLKTLVLVEENKTVGYGHLDVEKEIVWLGVCVLPDFQGKGYGKLMMRELIDTAKGHKVSKINLAVDKVNKTAINLYEKFNFKLENEFETFYKYCLEI